jgi:hypothetical protein
MISLIGDAIPMMWLSTKRSLPQSKRRELKTHAGGAGRHDLAPLLVAVRRRFESAMAAQMAGVATTDTTKAGGCANSSPTLNQKHKQRRRL